MEEAITIKILLGITGTVIMLLLSVLAYFLKQVHSEIKKMSDAFVVMSNRITVAEEQGKAAYDLVRQEIRYLEKRIEKIENLPIQ
jgi:hypothetical protein